MTLLRLSRTRGDSQRVSGNRAGCRVRYLEADSQKVCFFEGAKVGVFKGVALLRLIRDAQMTRCRMKVRRSVVRDAHMVG